jgi:hypothetical protein
VTRALTRLKRNRRQPIFFLGRHYRGLSLVQVDTGPPEGPVDLSYADCTSTELSTLGLDCHRDLHLEEWFPIPGEISTQGRCTFTTTIRGVTVARFPVNPQTLRFFARGTTVEITTARLPDELAAARALRGVNVTVPAGAPVAGRDVHRRLGRCRPPQHPTVKQAYEAKMKSFFTVEYAFDPSGAPWRDAKQAASAQDDFRTHTLLLRHESERISAIKPPPAVADLQPKLAQLLRAYAVDLDRCVAALRAGDWKDDSKWGPESRRFAAQFRADAGAIDAVVNDFRKRGYHIAGPSD